MLMLRSCHMGFYVNTCRKNVGDNFPAGITSRICGHFCSGWNHTPGNVAVETGRKHTVAPCLLRMASHYIINFSSEFIFGINDNNNNYKWLWSNTQVKLKQNKLEYNKGSINSQVGPQGKNDLRAGIDLLISPTIWLSIFRNVCHVST